MATTITTKTTPDTVKTRIGDLTFERGFPSGEHDAQSVRRIDYQRAVQAYMWAYPAVSFEAIRIATKADLEADIHDLIIADNFADPEECLAHCE